MRDRVEEQEPGVVVRINKGEIPNARRCASPATTCFIEFHSPRRMNPFNQFCRSSVVTPTCRILDGVDATFRAAGPAWN
jgi:hypothetical protein